MQAEIDGDRLTDARAATGSSCLLVNAGGDTTRNLLAAGVQLLFDHPDERARLQGDLDGLLPTAVDEMLRYTSPVVHFRRTVMDDTVIRDQPITAGDKVMVFYGSGNRDEDVFAEPDRFDVGRDPNPHMAFGGGGPHLCLGMHVARIEIVVAAARAAHPVPRPRAGGRARAHGVELHRGCPPHAGAFHRILSSRPLSGTLCRCASVRSTLPTLRRSSTFRFVRGLPCTCRSATRSVLRSTTCSNRIGERSKRAT